MRVREKNFNTGLRGVLFEARHFERMGSAIWLYGWLVLRQTHQSAGLGWVLGGTPVCYREIEGETGFNRRTLERWMRALRREGYIETEGAPGGVVIRITKAKKFIHPSPAGGESLRRTAEGVRQATEQGTHSGVANRDEVLSSQHTAERIGSSSVEGIKEREEAGVIHRNFHRRAGSESDLHRRAPYENQNQNKSANPPFLGKDQRRKPTDSANPSKSAKPQPSTTVQEQFKFLNESRLRWQMLCAEREEAVRRELAVGTGPEVRRS